MKYEISEHGHIAGEFCQDRTAVFAAHLIEELTSTCDLKVPIRNGQEFKALEGIYFFFLVTQTHKTNPD